MRYRSHQHIRKASEFQAVRTFGTRRECGFFCLNLLACADRDPAIRRAGFIASRRVGGAVQRNRAKRMMREAFRHQQESLPTSCDVVFIARKAIVTASMEDIERRLGGALKSLHTPAE